ncbi:39S ribosomal protein L43, mitochondrial-like [Dendronephthya gigantea]|uniref:39S ribosomal protein L43, mitochondrial-like n=1 Tax=Dendronephthya gigantea TaxID=151771 RepID=UPI001069D55C|nr:39S ribosomal protein L43, mitochondrial-like [Dendronephthya gigantea]
MAVANAFGRYICQLKRLTFNFCPVGGSSRAMREFVDKKVIKFTESNPNIAVYIVERPGRHPRIVANYLSGSSKVISLKNTDTKDIEKWINRLQSESGKKLEKNTRRWYTDNPSIQGTWTPFLNNSPCHLDLEEKAREKLGI